MEAATAKAPLTARVTEMAAIFMIGDGLLGLVQTERHTAFWKDRALGAERTVRPFVRRPGRRRLYALVQIAAGLALAARQRSYPHPHTPSVRAEEASSEVERSSRST